MIKPKKLQPRPQTPVNGKKTTNKKTADYSRFKTDSEDLTFLDQEAGFP